MEPASVNCASYDATLQYVKLLQKPVKYHTQDWNFPLAADAIANVILHYPDNVETVKCILRAEANNSDVMTWSWKVPQSSSHIALPCFSETHPFLAAVLPKYSLQFEPEPQQVEYDAICYPSRILYRLLAGQHTYPLAGTPHKIQYALNQVKLLSDVKK